MPKYDDLDLDVQNKRVSTNDTQQPDSTIITTIYVSIKVCPPRTTPCTARFCSNYDCA